MAKQRISANQVYVGASSSNGQILTSNGTVAYWANAAGGFTNGQSISVNTFVANGITTFNANVNVNGAIFAGGSNGSIGQYLTSNGSAAPYWSTVAGVNTATAYTFSNVITISNTSASGNNSSGALIVAGGIGANGNIYTAGRVGYANTANTSVAYSYYNATAGSIDTVFG